MIHSLCNLLQKGKLNNLVPYFCNSKEKDNAGHKLQNVRRRKLQLRKRRKDKLDLKRDRIMQEQEFRKEILAMIQSLDHKTDFIFSSMNESQKDEFTKALKNKTFR